MLQNYNGTWIHNFLKMPEEFHTKIVGPGQREFEYSSTFAIHVNDIIIKWSDDGANKTVWKVIETSTIGSYPSRVHCGVMVDLIASKKLTRKIADAVKLADSSFTHPGDAL